MITLKEGFIWLSKVAFDHTDVADLMPLDTWWNPSSSSSTSRKKTYAREKKTPKPLENVEKISRKKRNIFAKILSKLEEALKSLLTYSNGIPGSIRIRLENHL